MPWRKLEDDRRLGQEAASWPANGRTKIGTNLVFGTFLWFNARDYGF
jgi:hypothetical protein